MSTRFLLCIFTIFPLKLINNLCIDTLKLCTYSIPLPKLHSNGLALTGDFLTPSVLLYLLVDIQPQGRAFLSSPWAYLFVYHLCHYGLMDSYFIQWLVIYYHYLFPYSSCTRLSRLELLHVDAVSFWHCHIILEHVLTFWHKKEFQAQFILSLPQPWIWPFFSKWSKCLSEENDTWKPRSRSKCAHCCYYSIAAIASTQQTELEYTYMSTHTHTSVLNKNQEFVLIFLNLIQWHKKHSSFPPFYTCSCFF